MQSEFSFDYNKFISDSSGFLNLWYKLKATSKNLVFIYNISENNFKKQRLLKIIEQYNDKIVKNNFKNNEEFLDLSTVVFGHIQIFSQRAFKYDIICKQTFNEINSILKKIRKVTTMYF
ncbi:MAG: hypothetical protein M0R46_17140 [Candidatus Muirbacterium halophilum]|nr:hypothetical protein [Candidatus Muirbacterium halophilum]